MKENFYSQEIEELYQLFKTDSQGLSAKEAERRLKENGANKLAETKPDSYWLIFFRQFQSPLIYVLLIAGVVIFLVGEYIDSLVVIFVLLFNAILGTFQEGKAQNAALALRKFSATEATVLRDGQEVVVPSEEIVPGDIVFIEDGNRVPADGRLISVNNLKLDESSLTGESTVVTKDASRLTGENISTADQINMIFSGTYVTSGHGWALVIKTGLNTLVGQISVKLESLDADMPLKGDIKALSKLIVFGVLVINIFLIFIGYLHGNTLIEMLKIAVAVSVSAIPEGLPVVITLVLAAGVWRMSQRNALVKRLQAVEALGQAEIIAVDKTGTVTKNELMVSQIYLNHNLYNVTGEGYKPEGEIFQGDNKLDSFHLPSFSQMMKVAVLSANARVFYNEESDLWKITGDPTEASLVVLAKKFGFHKDVLEKEYQTIAEIPFSSALKYRATLNEGPEGVLFTQTGAAEVLIDRAEYILINGEVRQINDEDRHKLHQTVDYLSNQGLRVLACGFSGEGIKTIAEDQLPPLILVGLFAMSDVIRPEAFEALERSRSAGIKVVMITGDHITTARAIARQVGIYNDGDDLIAGKDLEALPEEELLARLDNITVFARVSPEHKLRIIDAYKKKGRVVAMTGDGVNDALSLSAADLGVAMGKIGTEVAKESADIILLDDNFGSIVSAVEEGRNIFNTIKKVVLYLFSTSLGEVIVIATAILVGWPLPLLASQIIWLNLVTHGFLVAPLALDPKDENLLKEPFKKPNKWFFDRLMLFRTLLMTSAMAIGALLVLWFYLPTGPISEHADIAHASTMVLTVLVIYQWFNVWNCRSSKRSIFSMKVFENKYLVVAAVFVFILHLLAIYTPLFQFFLRTVPLSFGDWLIAAVVALSIILVEEVRKFYFRLRAR